MASYPSDIRPNCSEVNKNVNIFLTSLTIWPHRLTVRTPGSHPGNRGSIPREVTIERASLNVVLFLWCTILYLLIEVWRWYTSNMQKLELIIKASDWEEAKSILSSVHIHQKSRDDYKEINGLFIVKVLLETPLTGQAYADIKDHRCIGILSDSASQKRAEEIFREVYKVETQLRKLLLHVSDTVQAYYDILFQLGQYTHEFSNSERTLTYKGTLNTMATHLTMGEIIEILRFDFSWSTRPLGASDLNTLLSESSSFEEFKLKLGKQVTPTSIWEVITEQILQKELPWEHVEKDLMRLKRARDNAAHHFVFTEKQKDDAVKLAKKVLEQLKPPRAMSEAQLEVLRTIASELAESVRSINFTAFAELADSIRQINFGAFAEIAKQQSILAETFKSNIVIPNPIPRIDFSGIIPPVNSSFLSQLLLDTNDKDAASEDEPKKDTEDKDQGEDNDEDETSDTPKRPKKQ